MRAVKIMGPDALAPGPKCPRKGNYFSEVLMASKFELSLLPRPFTAVMIAIAIPAAIRPYSMAVAPDSSLKNDLMIDMAGSDLGLGSRNSGSPCSSCPETYGPESKVVLTGKTQLSGYCNVKFDQT